MIKLKNILKSSMGLTIGVALFITIIAFGIMSFSGILSTGKLTSHVKETSQSIYQLNKLNKLTVVIENFLSNNEVENLDHVLSVMGDYKESLQSSLHDTQQEQNKQLIAKTILALDHLTHTIIRVEFNRKLITKNREQLKKTSYDLGIALTSSLEASTQIAQNLSDRNIVIQGPSINLAMVNANVNSINSRLNQLMEANKNSIYADQKRLITEISRELGKLAFKTPSNYKQDLDKLRKSLKSIQIDSATDSKNNINLIRQSIFRSDWSQFQSALIKALAAQQSDNIYQYDSANVSARGNNRAVSDLIRAQVNMGQLEAYTSAFINAPNDALSSKIKDALLVIKARTKSAFNELDQIKDKLGDDRYAYVMEKSIHEDGVLKIKEVMTLSEKSHPKIEKNINRILRTHSRVVKLQNSLQSSVDTIASNVLKAVENSEQYVRTEAERAIAIMFLCLLFGMVSCVTAFTIIWKKVLNPIKSITNVLKRISKGDLDVNISTPRQDEIGAMLNAAKVFKDNITELRHVAMHDGLTNLPNRAAFNRTIKRLAEDQEKSKLAPFAIHMVDLDKFKEVNDDHGHPAGDEVIIEAGQRILSCLKKGDVVARLGGDEFAIIQYDVSTQQEVRALAEAAITSVTKNIKLKNSYQVQIGASIGAAIFPYDSDNNIELVSHADTALYVAKNNGRGKFEIYNADMDFRSKKKKELIIDLKEAIKNHDFVTYLQPRMDLHKNEICAYEALIRWNHPEHGFIQPNDFIPLAEETGLIIDIGMIILEDAMKIAKKYLPGKRISVNLSPNQFKDRAIVKNIEKLIQLEQFNPALLELEITEHALIEDDERAIAVMKELKEIGLLIALDDFGSGYSSFSYLKIFPFDTLKIDRSFLKQVSEDKTNAAIVKSMISLTKSMGMTIVAEGVETEEILNFLIQEECDEIQGYILGKPQPVEKLLMDVPQEIRHLINQTECQEIA